MWVLRVCWVLLGTLGAGSAQLLFENVPFVEIDSCNVAAVILPCVVTNLKYNQSSAMFVTWMFQGKKFFIFDGVDNNITRNGSFQSAAFLNHSMLPYGIVSLLVSRKEALLGNYTCEVTESNREGETRFELRNSSGVMAQDLDSEFEEALAEPVKCHSQETPSQKSPEADQTQAPSEQLEQSEDDVQPPGPQIWRVQ